MSIAAAHPRGREHLSERLHKWATTSAVPAAAATRRSITTAVTVTSTTITTTAGHSSGTTVAMTAAGSASTTAAEVIAGRRPFPGGDRGRGAAPRMAGPGCRAPGFAGHPSFSVEISGMSLDVRNHIGRDISGEPSDDGDTPALDRDPERFPYLRSYQPDRPARWLLRNATARSRTSRVVHGRPAATSPRNTRSPWLAPANR